MQTNLERKTEAAIAARLKQVSALSKLRLRKTVEDSRKINQDLIISATRGEGNPPYSGVYDLEVTVTFAMKLSLTNGTLPIFLQVCEAVESVLNIETYQLAKEVSACINDFHCYEIAVIDKDDTPEDNMHQCTWTLTVIAMPVTFSTAEKLNS